MTAPEISDSDLEALCRRAIADPHSITRDEHNTIWRLPPPAEEDRLCIARTGSTRAELVAKALAAPDDLTRDEAGIVLDPRGVLPDNAPGAIPGPDIGGGSLPDELAELCDQATGALALAAGENGKRARLNAVNREVALNRALTAEADRHFEEWEAARRLQNGTPWIRDLIKNGLLDAGCWGLVVFRTAGYGTTAQDKEAWRRFREYFDAAAEATILHFNSGPLLLPKFRAVFVEREELDGASDEQLRVEFKRLRDGGAGADRLLPEGIRTSCFLVADRASIENDAVKTGFIARDPLDFSPHDDDPAVYIRAVHPDFQSKEELVKAEAGDKPVPSHDSAEQDGGMQGFTGAVTLALPRVFDWLNCVCFESERGSAWEGTPLYGKGWHDIYSQTKVPEEWVRDFAPNAGLVSYQPWEKIKR